VTAFNQEVGAYNAAKVELARKNERLSQSLREETELTEAVFAEARKHPPAGSGNSSARVVMYTTQWCPACKAAKQYFQQRGISYDEIDVEASPENGQKFQSLGGSSVPLIIVNGESMAGFDKARLDQLL
jgi:glutaredoxin-like YruB-family protein